MPTKIMLPINIDLKYIYDFHHKNFCPVQRGQAEMGQLDGLPHPASSTSSWLQSNWQVSPGGNASGTKAWVTPGLPERPAFHCFTKRRTGS